MQKESKTTLYVRLKEKFITKVKWCVYNNNKNTLLHNIFSLKYIIKRISLHADAVVGMVIHFPVTFSSSL
jgi:hypothetical protein